MSVHKIDGAKKIGPFQIALNDIYETLKNDLIQYVNGLRGVNLVSA